MAGLSQAQLEKAEGDHTSRMRKVNDILDEGGQYRQSSDAPWHFGALTVSYAKLTDDVLVARDPDGGEHCIDIPDVEEPDKSLQVEEELRGAWEEWLDAL